MTSDRPTLKTISDLTGFARTTVSRALGDAPDISEATKATIRHVADQVGYRPVAAGVRLRTGRTRTVALVLHANSEIMNHTATLIGELSRFMGAANYDLIVKPFGPGTDPIEPVKHVVRSGSADGIVLNQTLPNDPRVRYLARIGMPFVTHGRTACGIDHAYVDFDNRGFARRVADCLRARGRRSILLIPPPRAQLYASEMIAGLEAGLGPGMALRVIAGSHIDDSRDRVRAAFEDDFARHGLPDAIYCPAPMAAIEAVSVASAMGGVLGETYDLVCKEGLPLVARCFPKAITAREDVTSACQIIAKAMLQAIEQPDAPPIRFLDAGPPVEGPAL